MARNSATRQSRFAAAALAALLAVLGASLASAASATGRRGLLAPDCGRAMSTCALPNAAGSRAARPCCSGTVCRPFSPAGKAAPPAAISKCVPCTPGNTTGCAAYHPTCFDASPLACSACASGLYLVNAACLPEQRVEELIRELQAQYCVFNPAVPLGEWPWECRTPEVEWQRELVFPNTGYSAFYALYTKVYGSRTRGDEVVGPTNITATP